MKASNFEVCFKTNFEEICKGLFLGAKRALNSAIHYNFLMKFFTLHDITKKKKQYKSDNKYFFFNNFFSINRNK